MRVDTSTANQAIVWIDPGEQFYFALTYLRGRDFGVPFLPPCPLGSPFMRLYHGCYWLGQYQAKHAGSEVRLTGPTVIGHFRTIELPAGASCFLNSAHLVGFAFQQGGRLRTKMLGLLSPTMWALGHPLPVIAHGPGTVLVYGEGLHEVIVEPGAEYIPSQVVSFDAARPFLARALNPDGGFLSHVSNAIGRQARWVFRERTALQLVPINRPGPTSSRLAIHLIAHIVFWVLLVLMLNL